MNTGRYDAELSRGLATIENPEYDPRPGRTCRAQA
jgi:hypothetical protein